MRNLLILLFFFFPLFTFSQIDFRIEGKILNGDSISEIIPFSLGAALLKSEKVEVVDGNFVVEGTLKNPNMMIFNSDKIRGGLALWISESGTTKASFYVKNYDDGLQLIHPFNAEGNQEVIDFVNFQKNQNELNDILRDHPFREQEIADYIFTFLEARANSTFAPMLMRMNINQVGLERANFLYMLLDDELKNSEDGVSFKKQLVRDETNQIGTIISDFKLMDTSNTPLSLYQISNEFIIIDFWASWCAPCRVANKEMNTLYPELIKKGVSVLGVSLDEDRLKWISAIQKDSLKWYQGSDLKGYHSEVVKSLKISSIPYKILIDKEKRIVAVGLQNIKNFLKIQ